MAKIKLNQKELYEKLLKRTEFYAAGVRKIMQERIGEIAAMCAGLEVDEEKPFAFSDYPDISPKVQEKLRQMYSEVYQSVRGNVIREWNYSNVANDALVKGVFGRKSIESPHFARYFARNKEAMQQFFARTQQGLNLSQRVWRCVGQAKEELELALDLGLGEGKDAGQLSRDVRKYLNDPEKLFRRVRNKRGELVLSRAAKAYHPGQGVYRSSYKNAMRLTRTETNMAYRTADCTRWQQLDFVLGYEVKVSKNHPVHDICDELAGVYPKGFLFRGWHPHCYCYLVPKLCSEQELGQLQDMILEGRDTGTFAPAGIVTEPPAGYMEWVANNTERIEQAKSLPYFIRDNYKQGDISKGFSFEVQLPHKKTVWEIAEERHAQRDDDAVQAAWDERKATNKAKVVAGNVLEAADSRGFKELGIDTAELEEAIKAGKRTDIELKTRELAKSMAAKQKAVRRAASNVQAAYGKYNYELLGGMDAELAELEAAVKGGKLTEINSSTRKLAKTMSAAKKAGLAEYAEQPTLWGLTNEFGEVQAQAFMANWAKHMDKKALYGWNDATFLKKVIEKELYYANLTPDKYPTTKKFIYFFERQKVLYGAKLELAAIQGDIDAVLTFAATTKSQKLKDMAAQLASLTSNTNKLDMGSIKNQLAQAQKEVDRLNKERLARLKKKGGGAFDIEQFWSEADRNQYYKLRGEYEKALAAVGGNERDYNVIAAMQRLADFTSQLGEKYLSMQPTLENVDGFTEAEVKKLVQEWLKCKPINPKTPTESYGIWGASHGGVNWCGGQKACEDLANYINAHGGNITAKELATIREFTRSSNFICDYLYGASKISDIVDPMEALKAQRVLELFKTTINHAIESMPRFNGITYRGLNIYPSAIADPTKDGFWNSIMEAWNSKDKVWRMVAPTSSTTSIRTADDFADGIVHTSKGQRVIMKIHGKTGVDIHKIGYFGGGESEITFRAGSKFRLLKAPYKVTKTGGLGKVGDWCVEIEEIL